MGDFNLKDLRKPFRATEIEWRIQSAGRGPRGIWARVVPYIKARAIMDRLDEVCGSANWQDAYDPGPNGGILCGISIRIEGEWVTKRDGAANTEVKENGQLDEDTNIKGGISASLKRAGVKWGIGRYLYDLPAAYARIVSREDGGKYSRLSRQYNEEEFYWLPPVLPAWALPEGAAPEQGAPEDTGLSAKNGEKSAATAPLDLETARAQLIQYRDRGFFPVDSPMARTVQRCLVENNMNMILGALDWAKKREGANG